MKKVLILQMVVLSMIVCSQSVWAQGYQWVIPGEYTFGTCGNIGGDSAPSTYRNVKYYDRYSCNKAYNEEDRCYVIAMHMQNEMQQAGVLAQCGNWLQSQLRNCQNYVRSAGSQCSQLSQ